MTDAQLETKLTGSYELGIWSATDSLSNEFERRSGEIFAARQDEEAKWLRGLADELKERAVKLRKDYDTKYPK